MTLEYGVKSFSSVNVMLLIVLFLLASNVLCINHQQSCYETCLRLVTIPTNVVSDGCTLSDDELFPNNEKGTCTKLCKDVVGQKCNKTGSCSFDKWLGNSISPFRQYSNFTSINLRWNISSDADFYILHLESNQIQRSTFEIFPFVPKYYFVYGTNLTDFINFEVTDLLAEVKYKFRVSAISYKGFTNYSEWSPWYETNNFCRRINASVFIPRSPGIYIYFPCPVTHLKMNLTIKIPGKSQVVLDALLSWIFPKDVESLKLRNNRESIEDKRKESIKESIEVTVKLATHPNIERQELCESYHNFRYSKHFAPVSGKGSFHLPASDGSDSLRLSIHFGCRYYVEAKSVAHVLGSGGESFSSKRLFHIPECLNNVRSCPLENFNTHTNRSDIKSEYIDTFISRDGNNSFTTNVTWYLDAWKNMPSVEYFYMTIEHFPRSSSPITYYHSRNDIRTMVNITSYTSVFKNMSAGKRYKVIVRAYHGVNCLHNKIERESFEILLPCIGGCDENAVCYPPDTYDGSAKCKCNYKFKGNGTVCTAVIPCEGGCSLNATCHPPDTYDGSASCRCKDNFTGSGTYCIELKTTGKFVIEKKTESVNVAAIVVPLLLVVVITISLLVWFVTRRMKKQSQRAQDLVNNLQETPSNIPMSSSGSNLYQHFPSISNGAFPGKRISLPEGREVNVLYVPQEIQNAIASGLTDGYEFNADKLRFGSRLGQGAFGHVYRAEAQGLGPDPAEWIDVAVKTLSESAKQKEIDEFIEEISLMKNLGDHENVIKMLGCCTISVPVCLILEYAPYGNLQSYLRNLRSKLERQMMENRISKEKEEAKMNDMNQNEEPLTVALPESENDDDIPGKDIEDNNFYSIDGVIESDELESFALQIAKGMAFVASRSIVHRDLAARNILIGCDRVLKISDFGLSREGVYVKTTSGKIPLRWLSVEAIRDRTYSSASDVWAFGIVLWEICTLGGFPYPTISDRDLLIFLESGKRLEKPSNCTDEIYSLMLECWKQSAEERPTFSQLRDVLWKLNTSDSPYVNVDPLENFSLPPTNEDISGEDVISDFPSNVLSPEPNTEFVRNEVNDFNGISNPACFDDGNMHEYESNDENESNV